MHINDANSLIKEILSRINRPVDINLRSTDDGDGYYLEIPSINFTLKSPRNLDGALGKLIDGDCEDRVIAEAISIVMTDLGIGHKVQYKNEGFEVYCSDLEYTFRFKDDEYRMSKRYGHKIVIDITDPEFPNKKDILKLIVADYKKRFCNDMDEVREIKDSAEDAIAQMEKALEKMKDLDDGKNVIKEILNWRGVPRFDE